MKFLPLLILILSLQGGAHNSRSQILHSNITATVFWVGESGNESGSWDGNWTLNFGGVDDPKKRNGYFPEGFMPKENPFYIALPYNDIPKTCTKPSAEILESFADATNGGVAFFKNRWVKIIRGEKTCYAQWEDCGPFLTCDPEYVFGNKRPMNARNDSAGIDVSPAVSDYLGFSGNTKVDWQFVNFADVPDGPWKQIITSSPARW